MRMHHPADVSPQVAGPQPDGHQPNDRTSQHHEYVATDRVRMLLRPREAAELLGVGRTTVYELMRLGELPAIHIGRSVRIPAKAITEFIERRVHSEGETRQAIEAMDQP